MKKATRPVEQSRPRKADSTTHPSKIARLLAHLISGSSINRFEAERIGDHCLHSTIAVLANRHDLAIQRRSERVPNRFNGQTRVTRYSLPESEQEKARRVLAQMTKPAAGEHHAN